MIINLEPLTSDLAKEKIKDLLKKGNYFKKNKLIFVELRKLVNIYHNDFR